MGEMGWTVSVVAFMSAFCRPSQLFENVLGRCFHGAIMSGTYDDGVNVETVPDVQKSGEVSKCFENGYHGFSFVLQRSSGTLPRSTDSAARR